MSQIDHIFFARTAGGVLEAATQVEVVAGFGIVGDRYFGARDEPGQNLSLIEAEEIEAFNARHGRSEPMACTRRNIVTRGVRLAELIGREFLIGGLRLRGVEFCEPCLGLGESLASAGLDAPAVVRHFVHRAGIRADVLDSGRLRVGQEIRLG